jgi:hypothetical protein
MLAALAISHLLMPAALTLQDYHYLCLWLVRNINKNRINLSFSLVETGVPGEKPLLVFLHFYAGTIVLTRQLRY